MTIARIAIGSVQPGADATLAAWSVMAVLEESGYQVQGFHYRADTNPCDRVRRITGQPQRQLDSWLMPRDVCRELFLLGTQGADMAVVTGRYDVAAFPGETAFPGERRGPNDARSSLGVSPRSRAPRTADKGLSLVSDWRPSDAFSGDAYSGDARIDVPPKSRRELPTATQGGSLDTLCQWLDLPRVVVLDAERWQQGEVVDPSFPIAGIILDRVTDVHRAGELTREIELRWRAPVLGVLGELPQFRNVGKQVPGAGGPSEVHLRQLGRELQSAFRPSRFWNLADRDEIAPWEVPVPLPRLGEGGHLRIAVACDDAFPCSFPDTLEILEACGAELRAFSPLRSPELPAETDVVYLGCGPVAQHADELAANCCIRQALQAFAASGGRMYAEGAGVAYLSRQLVTGSGRRYPMANVLPAVALWQRNFSHPEPAAIHLRRSTWLGDAYQELRGYLHPTWRIDSWGATTNLALEVEHQGDLLGYRNVIGSRLQLNFAAQPHLLSAFFQPHIPEYVPA